MCENLRFYSSYLLECDDFIGLVTHVCLLNVASYTIGYIFVLPLLFFFFFLMGNREFIVTIAHDISMIILLCFLKGCPNFHL